MNPFIKWLLPIAMLGIGLALGTVLRGPSDSPASAPEATDAEAPKERPVLYWYDPMVPDQHFEAPGKSPFMDMMLVPKYADETGVGIAVDASTRQALGVRLGRVDEGPVGAGTWLAGELRFDPRQEIVLASRTEGTIVQLQAGLPWGPVVAGQRLMTLASPDIDMAARDLLALVSARSDDLRALAGPARLRLQRLGMGAAQIAAIESRGVVPAGLDVVAAKPGVISSLDVRAGARVMPGETLVRIQGLDPLWLEVAVPERQHAALASGTVVPFASAAFPGESFEATVFDAIPEIDPMTRSRTVRLTVPNAARRFASGQRVRVAWPGDPRPMRRVPLEALIRTGERNVVLREDAGRFRAVEVAVGPEDGAFVAIRRGLEVGDRIVLSGQFLIDSEANLQGALERLKADAPEHSGTPDDPAETHDAHHHQHGHDAGDTAHHPEDRP